MVSDQELRDNPTLQPPQKRNVRSPKKCNDVNLPEDVLEKIISFLPIKRATSCSILSTRFKNSWHLSRNLSFDKHFARGQTKENFIRIVNRVFDLNSSDKIQTFSIYFDPTNVENMVKGWIQKVVMKGVEELGLDFTQAQNPFELSSELIDFKSIRVLKLSFCKLLFLPQLFGLCFLRTLILEDVAATSGLITIIFSNCLVLEKLELLGCRTINNLRIFAPNLKNFRILTVKNCHDILRINISAPTLCSLCYIGVAKHIDLYSQMPDLSEVMINFTRSNGTEKLSGMRELMWSLNSVKVLSITGFLLEGLSPRVVIEEKRLIEVPFYLWNLKELHLLIRGSTFIDPSDIASFLQKCPYIQRILIDLGEFIFHEGLFWEKFSKKTLCLCNPSFEQLKYVEVKGFKFHTLELEMVKFFMRNGMFLENLVLVKNKNYNSQFTSQDVQMYHKLFSSWKISSAIKIDINS